MFKSHTHNQRGQSLVEVIIALGVATVIIITLTNITITAVRDAQAAKNQNLATKYTQEGVEVVRAVRDQNNAIGGGDFWDDLWDDDLGTTGACYSIGPKDNTFPTLVNRANCNDSTDETIETHFSRKIRITDENGTESDKKIVTVEVYWTDSRGKHTATQTTILTKWL